MNAKEIAQFPDWEKLDARVGKIESAEKVPDSNKLLRLIVDFGDFKRQIISGIAKAYGPEEIVGKQCVFIINLAPRMLAGLESQGMILACDTSDGSADLIIPDKETTNGSAVH